MTVIVNTNEEAERCVGGSNSDMYGLFSRGCTFWGLVALGFLASLGQ